MTVDSPLTVTTGSFKVTKIASPRHSTDGLFLLFAEKFIGFESQTVVNTVTISGQIEDASERLLILKKSRIDWDDGAFLTSAKPVSKAMHAGAGPERAMGIEAKQYAFPGWLVSRH
ncbi:MAG TPA: hypothetical protein VNO32_37920 [Candidatus Acidoferrum sp.]|nr:hypothetical protein [Candidatus Acidoferrum sp.]